MGDNKNLQEGKKGFPKKLVILLVLVFAAVIFKVVFVPIINANTEANLAKQSAISNGSSSSSITSSKESDASSSKTPVYRVSINNGTAEQTINCQVGEVVWCKFNYTNVGEAQFSGLRLISKGLQKNFTVTNITEGGKIDDGLLTYSIVWGPVKFMNPGDSRNVSFAVSPTKAGNFRVVLTLMTNSGENDKNLMDVTGEHIAQVVFNFNVTL